MEFGITQVVSGQGSVYADCTSTYCFRYTLGSKKDDVLDNFENTHMIGMEKIGEYRTSQMIASALLRKLQSFTKVLFSLLLLFFLPPSICQLRTSEFEASHAKARQMSK